MRELAALLAEMETPVPVVDLARVERNLDRMRDYSAKHHLHLRPHTKTHKSPLIARMQIERGAVGLTCATPRECEVMTEVADDLLLAYPPVSPAAARRIAALDPGTTAIVALDSRRAIEVMSGAASAAVRRVGVYVELDLGMHRVGVQGADEAVALVRAAADSPGLYYAGIAFYPGHIRQQVNEQGADLAQVSSALGQVLERLDREGLRPPAVSGGSTPTVWHSHEIAGVTEIRPGTYVYNDRTTAMIGACEWDDCALTVLATVVSTAVPGQAVVNAGTKSLGREPIRGTDAADGFGSLLEHPEVVVRAMSEEHGLLDLSKTAWKPEVGDLVRIIPNHACIVVHLFDEFVLLSGSSAERVPVAARGRGQAMIRA